MPVTLSADIPQEIPFSPVSPATMPSAWAYAIPDNAQETSPTPTDICEYEFDAAAQQTPSVTAKLAVPAGKTNMTVAAYAEADYLNEAGAAITSRWGYAETVVTTAPTSHVYDFPEFPEGTTHARLGFELREGLSEIVQRTNLHTDPRATATALFKARNSWPLRAATGITPSPVPGIISTCVAVACNATATGTNRGIDLWQPVDGATPTAANGLPVTPGDTLTLSCWVFSTKAATYTLNARCFSGTTWTAAATAGAGVAVPAATWTQVSVTVTVPAGAAYLCASVLVPASTAWTSAVDGIRVTGVLIEKAAALADWFDGSYSPNPSSVRWTGAANASTSELYTPGQSRNRSLVLSAVTVNVLTQAREIVGAALVRPLRRSVYDALNNEAPQIAVGTPGLLAGSITYLCDTFEEALALDSLYQFAGEITLSTGSGAALDGFTHMAVEQTRINAEKALPGKPSKWTVQAEVREVKE